MIPPRLPAHHLSFRKFVFFLVLNGRMDNSIEMKCLFQYLCPIMVMSRGAGPHGFRLMPYM